MYNGGPICEHLYGYFGAPVALKRKIKLRGYVSGTKIGSRLVFRRFRIYFYVGTDVAESWSRLTRIKILISITLNTFIIILIIKCYLSLICVGRRVSVKLVSVEWLTIDLRVF